jgi:hypothetical protein
MRWLGQRAEPLFITGKSPARSEFWTCTHQSLIL